MKQFIIVVLSNTIIFSFLISNGANALPQESFSRIDKSEQAIWKIFPFDENMEIQGGYATGFFIGENHFVTNFHVLSPILDLATDSTHIGLSQEGNTSILKIKRILALSAFYDLALLETEESVANYVSFREHLLDLSEDFFSIAYPGGVFTRLNKTGVMLYEGNQKYEIFVNHSTLQGSSGSPILDGQGLVSGVASAGNTNALSVIKINYVKEFIAGNVGTKCFDFNSGRDCMKEEIRKLKELAEAGSFYAQYEFALMYYEGKGLDQDFEKAFQWFKRSADQGYAPSQYKLAYMYENNELIQKDFQEAFRWYEKAAEQGYAQAQQHLGRMYYFGEGTQRDFQKALYWHKRAAEQGYSLAQFSLGYIYLTGEGTQIDFQKAFYWYKKAAEQGDDSSQHFLGLMYYEGKGVQKDVQEAFYWHKRAAEQGYDPAQYTLSLMFYYGEGTQQNLDQAVYWIEEAIMQGSLETPDWYKRLAEQGDAAVQSGLAFMYYEGKGVNQDFKQAFHWFKRSAEQGYAPSQYDLAIIYSIGEEVGVEKDLSKTYYWLIEASKQGYDLALSELTNMVCNAEGSEKDINKAISFFKEASEQNISGIQKCVDQLREKGIAIGGTGLLAVAGVEQAYAQGFESSAGTAFPMEPVVQAREANSGLDVESNSSTFIEESTESAAHIAFEGGEESISQTAELASEMSAELVTEVGTEIVGEVASDVFFGLIPGVGFGVGMYEAIAGVHVVTRRDLSPTERWISAGGGFLNLIGFGWLKNAKHIKHAQFVVHPVNKVGNWIVKLSGEQWSRFVNFVQAGHVERARGYLRGLVREIGFKKKSVPVRTKKLVRGGVSSGEELSEPFIVREGFGEVGSGRLHEAVDWQKWSDPSVSKVFRVKEPDEVLRGKGLFVRTPRGNQVLDYNNPEVLRWLRQGDVSQRKTLETLIEGGSKTGRISVTPLKEAVKESVDDLGALVY